MIKIANWYFRESCVQAISTGQDRIYVFDYEGRVREVLSDNPVLDAKTLADAIKREDNKLEAAYGSKKA